MSPFDPALKCLAEQPIAADQRGVSALVVHPARDLVGLEVANGGELGALARAHLGGLVRVQDGAHDHREDGQADEHDHGDEEGARRLARASGRRRRVRD